MKNGKPAVVITDGLEIWLGNTSDQNLRVAAGELFGFGTGQFEEVTKSGCLIDGSFQILFWFLCLFFEMWAAFHANIWAILSRPIIWGEETTDTKGLVVRWTHDFNFIASESKELLPLCQYLRLLATERGIGSLSIESHILHPKMLEAWCGVHMFLISFSNWWCFLPVPYERKTWES